MKVHNHHLRLSRFYGCVAKAQNEDIIRRITGRTILDIGCGYGTLVDQIKREMREAEVLGIDIDPEAIKIAKELYGLDVKPVSAHKMGLPDGSFDTVILREAIHHFNESGSLKNILSGIRRVCKKELIIFDPNPTWLIKFARKVIGHKDPEAPPDVVVRVLEENGFQVNSVQMRDAIAFPLSGGFVGIELIPNVSWIKKIVLNVDSMLNNVFARLHIDRSLCWRYLIYATKR